MKDEKNLKLEPESEYYAIISETQVLPKSFGENSLNVRSERFEAIADFNIRRIRLKKVVQAKSSIPKLSLYIESNMDAFYEKDSDGDLKRVKTLTMNGEVVVPNEERIPTHKYEYEFTKEDYKKAIDCGILEDEKAYESQLSKRLAFNDITHKNEVEIDQVVEDFDNYSVVLNQKTNTIFRVREIIPPVFRVVMSAESKKEMHSLLKEVHNEMAKSSYKEQLVVSENVREEEQDHLRDVRLNTELEFDDEPVVQKDRVLLKELPKKVQIESPMIFEEDLVPSTKKKQIEIPVPPRNYYEYEEDMDFEF